MKKLFSIAMLGLLVSGVLLNTPAQARSSRDRDYDSNQSRYTQHCNDRHRSFNRAAWNRYQANQFRPVGFWQRQHLSNINNGWHGWQHNNSRGPWASSSRY